MKQPSQGTVRQYIIDHVADHPTGISSLAVRELRVSRQAVNQQLHELVRQGLLQVSGLARKRSYRLIPTFERQLTISLDVPVEEHVVWQQLVGDHLRELPKNVQDICAYGLTEMVNNAIDHSEAQGFAVSVTVTPAYVVFSVTDSGIGIFRKLKERLSLPDEYAAVLDLAKGKLTTAPGAHTGEGIFFTARMFDRFEIVSGHLFFSHSSLSGDWLLEDRTSVTKGTTVRMRVACASSRVPQAVFEMYAAEEDDYAFTRTDVPVCLAMRGEEQLVSRSQAKRLLARLESFRSVTLDFKGVESIGQAFADEVFRVYCLNHPTMDIRSVNECRAVAFMIRRSLATKNRMPAE